MEEKKAHGSRETNNSFFLIPGISLNGTNG